MTLRSILSVAVCLLAMLVLGQGIGLSISSRALERATNAMLRDLEVVHTGNEVELVLYRHRYYDKLWLGSQSPELFAQRQQMEKNLWSLLETLNLDTRGTPRAAKVAELSSEIDDYFLGLERAYHSEGYTASPVYETVDPRFRKVLGTLQALVQDSRTMAAHSQAVATVFDDKMNTVGIALDIWALTLGALMIWLLRSRFHRPIAELLRCMNEYGRGAQNVRCHVTRPPELASISTQFNALADRLETQRRSQLEFLSAVAHDLRTPMTSMRVHCDVVRPGRPLPSEERIRKSFAVLAQQTDRLATMVSDLLDATRIEAGQLSIKPQLVNLVEIAREVISLFESGTDHVLKLEAPPSIPVEADPVRLNQVLTNLVSNAIKYSPEGGEVVLTLCQKGDRVVLSVTDHGLGIAPSELPRIFEPFHRSTGVKADIPGVGLGLSVARRIVESHGGRLSATSQPEHGTTFTLDLPAPHASAA